MLDRQQNVATSTTTDDVENKSKIVSAEVRFSGGAGDEDDCDDEENNVYIKELRRVFNNCATVSTTNTKSHVANVTIDGATTTAAVTGFASHSSIQSSNGDLLLLDESGLEKLCDQLQLTSHRHYIINRLFPNGGCFDGTSSSNSTTRNYTGTTNVINERLLLRFDDFKVKFIQLLPEIIEFNARDTCISTGDGKNSPKTIVKREIEPVNKTTCSSNFIGDTKKLNTGFISQSDYDTGNDLLSEFSDEGVVLGVSGGGGGELGSSGVNDLFSNDSNQQQQQQQLQLTSKNSALLMNCSGESRPFSASYCIERKFSNLSNHINHNHSSSSLNGQRGALSNSSSNPRIIEGNCNSSSGPILSAEQIEHILLNLGLADRGYLVPYDLRILCQHLGLNGLSPQDVSILFNQLDQDGDGKISVQDFVAVCPPSQSSVFNACATSEMMGDAYINNSLCRNLSQATTTDTADIIGFDSKTYIKSKILKNGCLTLFSSLDNLKTGVAKVIDLIQYWKCIGVYNGPGVLKKLHFNENLDTVNLKALSDLLLVRFGEKCDEDLLAVAAFCTAVAEILYLRDACDENREQIQHYVRELQQVNQRNSLLVEELDQNQQNLELRSQNQLKELEEKHQMRVSALEMKYKNERDQWYNEIKDRDELLHRAQQNESSFQHRLRQLERENLRSKAEVEDLSQTVKELEDINSELRSALEAASSVRSKNFFDEDLARALASSGSQANLHNLHYHNTKFEAGFRGNGHKRRRKEGPVLTPDLLKRAFRKQRLLLEESSEFESEPECYSYYTKLKKPLKKRQRLALVAHRLQQHNKSEYCLYDQTPSTSSNESSSFGIPVSETYFNKSPRIGECCSMINLHLTNLEQHLSDEFKFWTRKIRKDVKDLDESFASEKRSMVVDFKKQLEQVSFQHLESKRKALESQEAELRKKFDAEKRDSEIKWASERNIAERKFAEEKMQIMERLQHEFDVELRRIKESRIFFKNVHSEISDPNIAAKRKIEKLLDDQVKLQSHIKTLVGDLNFVRKKLTVEEKEKAKLKQCLEEMKLDLVTISARQKSHFESTIDQLKQELCFFGDRNQNLVKENESLKRQLSSKPDSVSQFSQTDHHSQSSIVVSCQDGSQRLKTSVTQSPDVPPLSVPFAKDPVDSNVAEYDHTQPSLVDDSSLPSVDSKNVTMATAAAAAISSAESACEAEVFFRRANSSASVGDLEKFAASSVCCKLSQENLLLLARLKEQELFVQTLSGQLRKQTEQASQVASAARKFSANLQTFERNNYESVKIDAIKNALVELYLALDKKLG